MVLTWQQQYLSHLFPFKDELTWGSEECDVAQPEGLLTTPHPPSVPSVWCGLGLNLSRIKTSRQLNSNAISGRELSYSAAAESGLL